jgi:hypothetical protein
MKLNITNSNENFIDGCYNINVNDYDEKVFDDIPQSSCDMVIITQCLGELSYHKCHNFLTKSADRVRTSGTISISLLDVESLFVAYLNGSLDSREISEMLEKKITALRYHEVKQILTKAGIALQKVDRKNNLLLINGIKK